MIYARADSDGGPVISLALIAHIRTVAASAVSVPAAAIAGGITAGGLGALISAAVAVGAGLASVIGFSRRRVSEAEKRGKESRNDEVRSMQNQIDDLRHDLKTEIRTHSADVEREARDKEFYRREYAALLQARAGASVVPLPPSERDTGRLDGDPV